MNLFQEAVSIHPNLLIADSLIYDTITATFFFSYIDIPTYGIEFIIKCFSSYFKEKEEFIQMAKDLKRLLPSYRKAKLKKNKTITDLNIIRLYKSMLETVKGMILKRTRRILMNYNLYVLLPFIDDKVLEINRNIWLEDENSEPAIIGEIATCLTEHQDILAFDQIIETLFPFSTLQSPKNETDGFIKIPLWNFPPIIGLTYEQIKQTRENLAPAFAPFKEDLKDISDQLFKLSYSSENFYTILQLVKNKLMPHLSPLQQSIDESLYLGKIRKQLSEKLNLQFCLGIASAETIINFYEKTEVVLPYISSEIKDQTRRHIDLQSSHIFLYYEINGIEEIKNTIKSSNEKPA
ncbi:MAG: hypothetical protein WCH34_01155 [Bacteroidota bacterium]